MVDWRKVTANLNSLAASDTVELDEGQRRSLKAIAKRIYHNGVIIADEVGMGKTRIATTVTKAVIDAGGRVAILVPPGLGFQWGDELRKSHVEGVQPILRSLWQYLKAWECSENPSPWFEQDVVLISHAFCNWRLGANTDSWRWALLPELYAYWRKLQDGRYPRGYHRNELLNNEEVKHAAKSIANVVNAMAREHPSREQMDKFAEDTPWPDALAGGAYARNEELRPALEKAVGLGLGVFDLIVIDEAHKSRGQESGLNRLLEHVVLHSDNARRLAMTATPIELDISQWQQILERIGVTDNLAVNDAITDYANATKRVQQLPNNEQARNEFFKVAQGFQTALGQYLLRRDKREVQSVQHFSSRSGKTHSDYRNLSKISVSTADLSLAWKQAVCAAESLSFVARGVDDQTAKRLRLTLGNGHGISALMDEALRDEKEDPNDPDAQADAIATRKPDKKLQRIEWWKNLISRGLNESQEQQVDEASLYKHPAILATVQAVETICEQGEKVLVFGRFTRPMQALVRLLNARKMLRSLDDGLPWSQATLHKNERDATSAALRQLGKTESLESVNLRLEKQYRALENERERLRTRLRNVLSHSLGAIDEKKKENALALLARPIREMLATDEPSDDDLVRAFKDVVAAASDQDQETVTHSDETEENVANQFGEEILQRIEEEYGRTEGGFARLMNGSTEAPTRRLLQLAFNREQSSPKVLVAQSIVGREGLNLHEACRTVILLHAEWNPGIVEQQVGRVDRINSLWEKKLKEALKEPSSGKLPTINIHPVIFQGTYDEHNWNVLMGRWSDLRAQLHGVVITPSESKTLPMELVKLINDCAPNFSPGE